MPVIVTGTFILPDGEVAADRVITIRRANRGVVQQSGQVVLPDDVVIETDGTGQVLFDLMPGNYVGFARTLGGLSASFTMAVPDVDTIDVAAVINAADIPEGAAVGPPGPVGPVGASAYQVAVSEGFVGTEAEWLDSLVGPAGDDGNQGVQGPVGPSYNYRGESGTLINQNLGIYDTFTATTTISSRVSYLLLKPKAPIVMTSASIADIGAIVTNYDIMLLSQNGLNGAAGGAGPAGPPPPVVVSATLPGSPVTGTFYVVTG